MKHLLIIDDEENMRHMLSALLSKFGYRIHTASDGKKGLDMVEKRRFDFILCDVRMPHLDGMAFLDAAKPFLEGTTLIMMSAYGTIDTAIDAMKRGAYDYISKPFKPDEVYLTLKKAEEREALRQENQKLKQRLRSIETSFSFSNMVGRSDAMQRVFKLAAKAAQYDTTVLITGESGTGKELIARAIHFEGHRAEKPFIPVNCGGIPENLLESEFFGYTKGAFTGAEKNRKGLFEEACEGTIFLDEIGELPLTLQVKFLRVLQENEVRPIGSSKPRRIDVRVIAATSKNLEEEIREGRFRQDLFYRLNVFPIKLPPLRERTDDIPHLCRFFIDQLKGSLQKSELELSTEVTAILLKHTWPGNVRELENAIERAAILADGETLLPEHFPIAPEKGMLIETLLENLIDGFSLKAAQKVIEKHLIIKALKETEGNRTRATQLLEISHPSLLAKMKTYEIDL